MCIIYLLKYICVILTNIPDFKHVEKVLNFRKRIGLSEQNKFALAVFLNSFLCIQVDHINHYHQSINDGGVAGIKYYDVISVFQLIL